MAVLAALAACTPAAESVGALPPYTGAYPRSAGAGPASLAVRAEDWRPATEPAPGLTVDGAAAGFFAGIPPLGTRIPLRELAWPGRVRLADVDGPVATLRGDAVALRVLASEVRCGGAEDAGRAVELVVEVVERSGGLGVEPRLDGLESGDCELSGAGRRRLQRVAAEVYLWARAVARSGSEIPAEGP